MSMVDVSLDVFVSRGSTVRNNGVSQESRHFLKVKMCFDFHTLLIMYYILPGIR